MSNTNFNVSSNDLSNIFTSRVSTDPILSFNTKYTVNNNDLTNIFYPYTTGVQANETYYYCINSTGTRVDLSTLFQNKNVPVSKYTYTTGSNTIVTPSSNNNQIIFDINLSNNNAIQNTGYSSITFTQNCLLNVAVIGGGGYGGFFNTQGSDTIGGGGGGGGDVQILNNISIMSGTTYYIVVGNGSKDYTSNSRGYTSYFSTGQNYNYQANSQNSSTVITARGGDYGQSDRFNGTGGSQVKSGGNGANGTTAAQTGTQGTNFTFNGTIYIYGSGGPGGKGSSNTYQPTYPANSGNKTYGDGGPGANWTMGDSQNNTNFTIGGPGRILLYIS
jgi:hypothetical protein